MKEETAVSRNHGSGRGGRSATSRAIARKRNTQSSAPAPRQRTDTPQPPAEAQPADAQLIEHVGSEELLPCERELLEGGGDPRVPAGAGFVFFDEQAAIDAEVNEPAGGMPAAGPIPVPPHVLPDERLTAWEQTLIGRPDRDDPELRALRDDIGETLGLIAAPVHPRTIDTAILPTFSDDTKVLPAVGHTEMDAPPRGLLAPPIPSGAPVGPAIPGRYRVPTPHEPDADDGGDDDFEALLAASSLGTPTARALQALTPPEVKERFRRHVEDRLGTPAATTRPLPRIPAPYVPPPAPVPVTPGLLRKIFGLVWSKVVDLIRVEVAHFGSARIAAIHHSPTDQGATAVAGLYGFGCTPVYWDGQRYVGGEPREDRMHPSVVMHAFGCHVRDYRDPVLAPDVDQLPATDPAQNVADGQSNATPMGVAV